MCTQNLMSWNCGHEQPYGELTKCENYGKKDKNGKPLCKGKKERVVLSHTGTCPECST